MSRKNQIEQQKKTQERKKAKRVNNFECGLIWYLRTYDNLDFDTWSVWAYSLKGKSIYYLLK